MIGGSSSSSRSRLGFSRGSDSSGKDRATLGFSRGATRGSLGVVKSLYANAAHPRLGSSSSSSSPPVSDRPDPVVSRGGGGGGRRGGGCTDTSCTIPVRDRSRRREAIAEHHRQEDAMFPKPDGLSRGGGSGRNRGEGERGGKYRRKGQQLPDYLKRDYSKYSKGSSSGGEGGRYEDDYGPPPSRGGQRSGGRNGGLSAADRFGPRPGTERYSSQAGRGGSSSRQQDSFRQPEPEPEVYTFGPPTVAVKRSDHESQAPRQVRFEDEVGGSELRSLVNDDYEEPRDARKPAVTFSSDREAYHGREVSKHEARDAREVDQDLKALERLRPSGDSSAHESHSPYENHQEVQEPREVSEASYSGQAKDERYERQEPKDNHEMEAKFDSLLGMLDERFGALTSRSEQLEKIVEQLARSQLAMATTTTTSETPTTTNQETVVTKEEAENKSDDKSNDFYGKVGCASLPFFVELPPATLSEENYEEECDGMASKGDWIMLNDPQVHPDTQASWYPARHIDQVTGKRSTFWAPAALGDKPCFERFAAYPTAN